MSPTRTYQVGDRVRLTCAYAGGHIGEEATVIQVKDDGNGEVLSLDIFFDQRSETTRGTTVYLREVEPVR